MLKKTNERYHSSMDVTYALGASLTIEAIRHRPSSIEKIYYSSKAEVNNYFDDIKDFCLKNDLPLIEDDKMIASLSLKENCYVIGVISKYTDRLSDGDHIILKDFTEEGCLGTTLRSCVAFDFHDIVLIGDPIDHFDPRIIRSGMGASFQCRIAQYQTIAAYQKAHPDHHLYTLGDKGDKELKKEELKEPYGLILDAKQKSGDFYIAHDRKADGLLPEVQATIALYELTKIKKTAL